MKQQSIKFKGINVSFTDKGKGKAVVFLHGFLENQSIWKYFSEQLSKTQRVITVDLLGHGNTDCLSYVHTMEEMAEAVQSVLDYLKLRKYFLVGHSLGGYVSLALAEAHPDQIKGLVLFHSTAKADSTTKKKDRERAIKVVKRNITIFIKESIPNLFNVKYKPYNRGIAIITKEALKMSKQGVIAALEGMKIRLDREIILKFAPYPVLYIIGKEDNILSYQDLIAQVQLAGQGNHILLDKVGHMGFIEAKAETYKAIKQFVDQN
ncbi:MAG: alpha/beta hydrolase [Vicingus serpentipes]|nr:alpha/beta hydrolase [Vicingus serpentipes]